MPMEPGITDAIALSSLLKERKPDDTVRTGFSELSGVGTVWIMQVVVGSSHFIDSLQ